MNEFPKIAEGLEITKSRTVTSYTRAKKTRCTILTRRGARARSVHGREFNGRDRRHSEDAYGLPEAPEKEVADCLKTLSDEELIK